MTNVAKVYDVALINIPVVTADDVLEYFGNEQLCTFRNFLLKEPDSVFQQPLSADILVCYLPSLSHSIRQLPAKPENKPIIVITHQVDFEMRRLARQQGIELVIQIDDQALASKVYGFIKLFILNQQHQVLVVDDSKVDGMQVTS